MREILKPRDAGKFISENSRHVSIVADNIPIAARHIYENMLKQKYCMATWKQWPLHPKESVAETVDWIFVVDSLNFSFWLSGEKQFQISYEGRIYEDYEALCAALNRALKEGIPITTPSYYKDVTLDAIRHIFRSCNNTELPLLEQRTNILREGGRILCTHHGGSFSNFLLDCNCDVNIAMERVTTTFSSFDDVGIFDGRKVCFYKRVQILLADIWACFESKSFGRFWNIEELTMFADYRVPQALLAFGVLTYSNELMKRLQRSEMLDMFSREEMEIRGCSIHAVELIREWIVNFSSNGALEVNAVMLDFYLWDFATENRNRVKRFPEHHTRSTFY